MTLDEAREVGRIASTADGGCSTCVQGLAEMLQKSFPQFTWAYPGADWILKEPWHEEMGYEGDRYVGIDVSEPTAPTDVDAS